MPDVNKSDEVDVVPEVEQDATNPPGDQPEQATEQDDVAASWNATGDAAAVAPNAATPYDVVAKAQEADLEEKLKRDKELIKDAQEELKEERQEDKDEEKAEREAAKDAAKAEKEAGKDPVDPGYGVDVGSDKPKGKTTKK